MIISGFGGKHLFIRLILVAAVIGLAACGGSSNSKSKSSSSIRSVASSSSSVASDTTPKDFDLSVPQATYTPGELATTNTVTITEIDALAPVTVSAGASYSKDDGITYTTGDGNIANNQTLTVRVNADDTFGETLTVTVNVGTVEKTFQVVTEDADTAPEPFSFSPTPDADISTVYTAESTPISGINTDAPVTVSEGGSFCIVDCSGANPVFVTEGSVANGETVTVRGESAATNATPKSYTLTIGGESADWVVTTVADSTPPTAAIVFPTKVSLTDGATLTVRGTAEDVSGITGVTVSVLNGDTVVGDPVVATSFVDEGFARWTAEVNLTADTNNTLRVSVTDGASLTNAESDEIVVTHNSNYTGLDFPEGNETPLYELGGGRELELDTVNNRLLYVKNKEISSIDLATGIRSLIVSDESKKALVSVESVDGALVVTDSVADKISIFDETTQTFSVLFGDDILPTAALDIVFNSSRDLYYYVDSVDDSVFSLTKEGERTLISGPNMPEDEDTVIDGPAAIGVDETGRFAYLLSLNNSALLRVSLDTGAREEIVGGSVFLNTRDLTLDTLNGRLFVSDFEQGKLFAVNTETFAVTAVVDGVVGNDQFPGPNSLDFDEAKGILYFAAAKLFKGKTTVLALDVETGERVVVNKNN